MKKLLKNPLFLFAFGAIAASIIGYLINQLPAIPDFPHKTEILFVSVFTFTMLAALIAYWQAKQQPEDAPANIDPTIRPRLLEAEATKVKQRLQDSLHNLLMLDLMREEKPQQVGRKPLQTLYTVSVNNTTSQPQIINRMVDVLRRDDIGGRLLILGQPGSGKTTTLLELAEELLDKAKQHDLEPMPIIFELSAWRDDSVSILDWLVLQLKQEYNLPQGISRVWLEQGKILPLLDGLDELGLEKQRKCIRAINQYLVEDATRDLVVCCREEEYCEGEEQLSELHGAVCLQELCDGQIQDYLHQLNRRDLWQSIKNNLEFLELARTPLFLSMMVVAYQGRAIQTKEELFDAYIERRFELSPVEKGEFSRPKIMHFLAFLAKQLRNTTTEFLIEDMQPNWLHNKNSWWWLLYKITLGFIFAAMSSLVFKLISGFGLWLTLGLAIRLNINASEILVWLTLGLIVGFLFWHLDTMNYIEPIEAIEISLTRFFNKPVITTVIISCFCGLFFGYFIHFISGLKSGITFSIFVINYGLMLGLIKGLKAEIKTKSQPNQGIWASLKNSFLIAIILNIIFLPIQMWLIPFLISFSMPNVLSILLQSLTVFVALFHGGVTACIQHFSLRLVLWYNRYIPWNYAKFLSRAAERRLIQQIGGRYRFIHRLLLEHFADMRV
jgi:DNA polymerase III delta prime subunit